MNYSHEEVMEILHLFAYNNDELFIYLDDDENVILSANCSDLFYWGAADSEIITAADLPLLRSTQKELMNYFTHVSLAGEWLASLYSARKRNMRPQGAQYQYIPEKIAHLFDACGPERMTGIGNPTSREDFR